MPWQSSFNLYNYLYLNRCEINCHDKVSANNRLSVIGICVNCAQEGFTSESYRWEMHVQNESTGGWTPVVDLDSKTLIGTTESSIVLRHDALQVGKKYKLTCRVKNKGESRSTHKEVKALYSEWKNVISMLEIWLHAKLQV